LAAFSLSAVRAVRAFPAAAVCDLADVFRAAAAADKPGFFMRRWGDLVRPAGVFGGMPFKGDVRTLF